MEHKMTDKETLQKAIEKAEKNLFNFEDFCYLYLYKIVDHDNCFYSWLEALECFPEILIFNMIINM